MLLLLLLLQAQVPPATVSYWLRDPAGQCVERAGPLVFEAGATISVADTVRPRGAVDVQHGATTTRWFLSQAACSAGDAPVVPGSEVDVLLGCMEGAQLDPGSTVPVTPEILAHVDSAAAMCPCIARSISANPPTAAAPFVEMQLGCMKKAGIEPTEEQRAALDLGAREMFEPPARRFGRLAGMLFVYGGGAALVIVAVVKGAKKKQNKETPA